MKEPDAFDLEKVGVWAAWLTLAWGALRLLGLG